MKQTKDTKKEVIKMIKVKIGILERLLNEVRKEYQSYTRQLKHQKELLKKLNVEK